MVFGLVADYDPMVTIVWCRSAMIMSAQVAGGSGVLTKGGHGVEVTTAQWRIWCSICECLELGSTMLYNECMEE